MAITGFDESLRPAVTVCLNSEYINVPDWVIRSAEGYTSISVSRIGDGPIRWLANGVEVNPSQSPP